LHKPKEKIMLRWQTSSLAFLASLVVLLGWAQIDAAELRSNVLFIAVDDLRPELGCYGALHIDSPNIDALAASGRLFQRAYCQQAVCNPSRTSLMTGLRPDSIGVTGNHAHFRTEHPDVVTLPQLFKNHGYHTAAIGKIYHGVFPDGASNTKWDTMGDPESWSVPAVRFGPRYYYTEEGIAAAKSIFESVYKPQHPGPNDWTQKLVFGPATESPVVPDNTLYDGKVADAAVYALRDLKNKDKPFFLAVGFIKPHSPYIAPKKYFDLYTDVALPSQVDFPLNAPIFAGHGSGELRRYTDQPKRGVISAEKQRRVRQAYFACISYIDAQIGRVLQELERSDLSDNTIVVLYGDHGYHLGEQGLWGKTTNFELDTRVPLIVRTPGMKAAGKSSSSLVELLDLYPTLAELAGLPIADQLEGTTFAPILNDPSHVTKMAAFSQYPRGGGLMGYSLRTPTNRLTQWVHLPSSEIQATELYDYADGPIETNNIAATSPQVVAMLSRQLTAVAGFTKHRTLETSNVDSQNIPGLAMTSFEKATAGGFDKLETTIGTWTSITGRTIIDDKHAKTGKQCLQLTGGQKTSVTLDISAEVATTGVLTFWAERWTTRKPFSFKIEKKTSKGWQEIYNGDAKVRVGRSFLNHLKIPLVDDGIAALRFTCSSPPNTGILIDDLMIAPPQPQKIVSVEVVPVTLPALLGAQASPLAKLKVVTTGNINPLFMTDLQVTLHGDTGGADFTKLFVYPNKWEPKHAERPWPISIPAAEINGDGSENGIYKYTSPLATANLPVAEGETTVWVSCRLKNDANIDHRIGMQVKEVRFSNGQTFKLDAQPSMQRMGVAVRNGGDDGVHTFRIPGLATTNKGTLIGVYDVRRQTGGDLPGDIDVGMSRSIDSGRTWESMKTIMDMGGDPKWRYDGIGDPAVLVDANTGTIWVAATWSHGNRSWLGSGPGLKPDETGQLMLVSSEDDGVTWSQPINITSQVKKPEWCFILQGPGKGITMRDGTIVFAAQYQDPPEQKRLPHSTIIYSKDHGKTWHAGTGAFDDTTESQVVEIEPGVLMLNCRYNRKSVRVVMTTRDMGKTWKKHTTSERSLIEPGACMASLIDVDQEVGKDIGQWLLFSNPDSTRGRNHLTIKASPDRGLTWPKAHRLLLDEGNSAGYSCMSMIDEKTVGILYEGSQAHMTFQRIPLSDLLDRNRGTTQPTGTVGAAPPLDVFVLTGQSNSLGTVDPRDIREPGPVESHQDPQVPFFWSNRSTRSGDENSTLIGNSGGKFVSLRAQQGEGTNPVFWGPEIGFSRSLIDAGQQEFVIIKASRGGGGNRFWSKGSPDDHMYQHVLKTVADAVRVIPDGRRYRIRAILYVQGESDSESESQVSGKRLESLIANLRRDLPHAADARLLVGGIAATGNRRDVVRSGQAAAAERNSAVEYVNNTDLQSQLYDGLHFNSAAKLTVGERLAEHWIDIGEPRTSVLQLPQVFGSHMVLQAQASLPIWGIARPASEVTIQLGAETLKTTASSSGHWKVLFAPRAATSTPTSLLIQSGKERVTLSDILIGEVWVCAGQSNMEWPLSQSANGAVELSTAKHPQLRLLHLVGGARGGSGSYTQSHLARLKTEEFCEGQWRVASAESAREFSAVAWYFARELQQELNVPVGLICPAIGGTPTEAWISRDALEADTELQGLVAGNWLDNERLGDFCRTRGQQNLLTAMQAGDRIPGDDLGLNHSFKPGFMWSAGIKPLIPYAIRGAIWYQGESNAETPARAREHGQLFPLLIQHWREQWGQGDFPFLYVQLPGLNRPEWPWFRDGQRRTLDQLKNVGMAITIDMGHPSNVHPTLKKPVGQRLAKWALGTTYKLKTHATYTGPLLDVAEREGDSMVISFNHVGAGLKSSDEKPLRHFEVCGKDGIFHTATAKIVGKKIIAVSNSKVSKPCDVRYGWLPYPNPAVNLLNSANLPASPFTTESTKTVFARRTAVAERPNILFIISEDNSDHLGCYGEQRVHTPYLDGLASGGVRYTRAYVPYSVCSPSRAAFLTGLYTRQTGHIGLATHRFSMYRDFKTIPAHFQEAGYYTGFLGKTHINPERLVEDYIDHRAIQSANFGKTISIETYAGEASVVMRNAAERKKPFLLIINYADAHRRFIRESKHGFPTRQVDDEVAPFPWIGSDTPNLREELRDYFNCMNRLDEGVGMVLDKLDETGNRDNTLVIYISDHGADFPRGKGSIYENGTRIPMIVNYPKSFPKGKIESGMVSTIDILPTMLRAARLPVPKNLPGFALQDIDSDKVPPRKYIHTFTTGSSPNLLYLQFGIRDERYKLVFNPDRDLNRLAESRYLNSQLPSDQHVQSFLYPPEYELFDLLTDPHEWKNLADSAAHKPIRQRLLKAMQEFQQEIKDPFASSQNIATFIAEQKEYLHKPYKNPSFRWPHLDMFKSAQE
jgi:arylsulfatase A-like enzyme